LIERRGATTRASNAEEIGEKFRSADAQRLVVFKRANF
jgi:hypothetical protein